MYYNQNAIKTNFALSFNTAVNQDLKNISIWFKANKLAVNPSKSNVLTINPQISKAPPILNVTLNSSVLNQSNSV